ncbi:CAAX farnesyltransferase (FTase) subunit beta [Vanrija albida]|uniref:Protein farnesyltransferase subunit beta n=1 Tax=Vanrija albida TaxID=181172 RepID=A0ABR3Q333_9TREE
MATSTYHPSVFSFPPGGQFPSDGVFTPTLEDQRDTEDAIAELLLTLSPAKVASEPATHDGTTALRKNEAAQFMGPHLFKCPPGYTALDASKPWLMYWVLHSLDLLGIALDEETKKRAVATLFSFKLPTGGFAGGAANTQIAHLLPTYAAVMALAISGGATEGFGWDQLAASRQDIYNFFMRMKKPDGGFSVCEGGEKDVRGTYCLLVVATALDILTPELLHNIDKHLVGCQTYEGGFASDKWTFGGAPTGPSAAFAEAHGGYTSCALLAHFLLASAQPSEPLESLTPGFPAPIDVDSAVRWSALMQGNSYELGGFRGRSNKLVDGCYSWWVGGGFPVLEELVRKGNENRAEVESDAKVTVMDGDEGDWVDVAGSQGLFNRVALQEYILLAGQVETGKGGGLRDKPGKRPDLYHTANDLSGLSIAQHHVKHSPALVEKNRGLFDPSKGFPPVKPTTPEGGWKSEAERQRARREVFANALGWAEEKGEQIVVGGDASRVNTTTPVFNALGLRMRAFVNYFYQQQA